jgi:hypothetical protein
MASRPSFLPSGGDTSTGGCSSLALLLVKSMSLWLDKHKESGERGWSRDLGHGWEQHTLKKLVYFSRLIFKVASS